MGAGGGGGTSSGGMLGVVSSEPQSAVGRLRKRIIFERIKRGCGGGGGTSSGGMLGVVSSGCAGCCRQVESDHFERIKCGCRRWRYTSSGGMLGVVSSWMCGAVGRLRKWIIFKWVKSGAAAGGTSSGECLRGLFETLFFGDGFCKWIKN